MNDDKIEQLRVLAKVAREVRNRDPEGADKILAKMSEIIDTFKRKKFFGRAVAERVAPVRWLPQPKPISDADVEKLISGSIQGALEHVAEVARRHQLWLMLYWNPEQTVEENHANARAAIDGGWNPNDEVIL